MNGMTIHEAAETTGWSPRMLRYLEQVGLIEPTRNTAGYRLFGEEHVERLRGLRALLDRFGCTLSDVVFAKRMRQDGELRDTLGAWLDAGPQGPAPAPSEEWSWEYQHALGPAGLA